MKPTWRGLGAERPIKESYVCLLQFGKGHDSLHPKSMGFLLPLPFYLLFSLSLAPDPKMDPLWLIHTDQLRGVPLPPSSHTCKTQRIRDFERAGESALLEACAILAWGPEFKPSYRMCCVGRRMCVAPGQGRWRWEEPWTCCPASLAESIGSELSDRSCLRKEGGA